VGGVAYRLNISRLLLLEKKLPLFSKIVRRFDAVLFRHTLLSLGCSQFHSVEQRLGRWLLAHSYRTGLKRLPFTHQFLARQLGVRRVTITNSLAALEKRRLITYRYGAVEIRDARRLKKVACECFGLAKDAINDYLHKIRSVQRPVRG